MKKLIFILLIISYTFAWFIDGNQLYQWGLEVYKHDIGQRGNWYKIGTYDGYVFGVFDSYNEILFCSPNNVKGRQVLDIVFKYLQNHPEIRNKSANVIILKSLSEIWPCKKIKK